MTDQNIPEYELELVAYTDNDVINELLNWYEKSITGMTNYSDEECVRMFYAVRKELLRRLDKTWKDD